MIAVMVGSSRTVFGKDCERIPMSEECAIDHAA